MKESSRNFSAPRVGLVVVNFGHPEEAESYISSLDVSIRRAVYFVDNFSSAANREAAKCVAERNEWKFLPRQSNTGFGAASNFGASAAVLDGMDVLLFLNPDATIDARSAKYLVEFAHENPETIVAPVIRFESQDRVWFAGGLINWKTGRASHSDHLPPVPNPDWLTGACLAVSSRRWSSWGGFREDFFLYWEDVELTQRWLAHGGQLIVLEGAVATHAVGGTQSGHHHASKSPLYVRWNLSNRGRFLSGKGSRIDSFRWWIYSFPYAVELTRMSWRRIFSFEFPSYVAAFAAGLWIGTWNLVAKGESNDAV